jgi:hypothetical protein
MVKQTGDCNSEDRLYEERSPMARGSCVSSARIFISGLSFDLVYPRYEKGNQVPIEGKT